MNKRIQELFHESIEDCDGTMKDRVYSLKRSEIEKFAELIIKECITQASISNGHGNKQWDKALTFAVDNIKKHFGVEEWIR